jgi:hypothetical protein
MTVLEKKGESGTVYTLTNLIWFFSNVSRHRLQIVQERAESFYTKNYIQYSLGMKKCKYGANFETAKINVLQS